MDDQTVRITDSAALDFRLGWERLAREIYAIGRASGFYDHDHTEDEFSHDQKLLLMVSEIIEAHDALRGAAWPGVPDDKLPNRTGLEVELGDAVIRIMNYGTHCGLDIPGAIVEKAAFNATRGHRHGDKRF